MKYARILPCAFFFFLLTTRVDAKLGLCTSSHSEGAVRKKCLRAYATDYGDERPTSVEEAGSCVEYHERLVFLALLLFIRCSRVRSMTTTYM